MKSRSSIETFGKGVRSDFLYRGFTGLSTGTADIAMENEEAQALVSLENAYCSSKGYISSEPPLLQFGAERQRVVHARYFKGDPNAVAYAARTGAAVELRTIGGAVSPNRWPLSATPTSTIFNRLAVFAAGDQAPQWFDGFGWGTISNEEAKGARYCCAVQERLALAGFERSPTEIIVSRVNDHDVYPSDEEAGDAEAQARVTKAFRIDIGNLVGTADRIRGLATFETGKMAVFTNERVIVYNGDPDYTKWSLDTTVTVNVGTISHNTIAGVGDELLFCSRAGVHSLRRAALNGTTMFTLPLSDDISDLYDWLYSSVQQPETISACFDREAGRYHVFFPMSDQATARLTLDIFPVARESQPAGGNWSLSTFAGLTCGDSLSGNTIFGSVSGFQLPLKHRSTDGVRGEGSVVTPILWHSDLSNPKQSHAMVLYASGVGRVTIDAENETGRKLNTVVFDLPDTNQADYYGVPLQRQFERPFQHGYVGLRLRLKIAATKQVRVFAVGVKTRPN